MHGTDAHGAEQCNHSGRSSGPGSGTAAEQRSHEAGAWRTSDVTWHSVGGALTPLLQGNRIGDDGARAMAVALQQNSSVTKLSLYVCLSPWWAYVCSETLTLDATARSHWRGRRPGPCGSPAAEREPEDTRAFCMTPAMALVLFMLGADASLPVQSHRQRRS